jgi:nitronate monooxygenase
MIRTPITDMLGIEHPVLLAPMGNVGGGGLAAAVSRAGGLGILGGGYCDPGWLEREIQAAGNASIGIGFITWALQALCRADQAQRRAADRPSPERGPGAAGCGGGR